MVGRGGKAICSFRADRGAEGRSRAVVPPSGAIAIVDPQLLQNRASSLGRGFPQLVQTFATNLLLRRSLPGPPFVGTGGRPHYRHWRATTLSALAGDHIIGTGGRPQGSPLHLVAC